MGGSLNTKKNTSSCVSILNIIRSEMTERKIVLIMVTKKDGIKFCSELAFLHVVFISLKEHCPYNF